MDREAQNIEPQAGPAWHEVSDDFAEIENPESNAEIEVEDVDNDRAHNLILEEMQPLYYFNVKSEKQDEEQQLTKPSATNLRINTQALREASTPFFLGSPANEH